MLTRMKSDKQLAANIERLREAAGLTREALSKAVGIDPQTLYQYERCLRWPKGENLDALAKALNVRPWELIAAPGEGQVVPAELRELIASAARFCGLMRSAESPEEKLDRFRRKPGKSKARTAE